MSEWHDIATAPHGTDSGSPYILLRSKANLYAVGAWIGRGDWYLVGGNLWKDRDLTHWMYIPPVSTHNPEKEE